MTQLQDRPPVEPLDPRKERGKSEPDSRKSEPDSLLDDLTDEGLSWGEAVAQALSLVPEGAHYTLVVVLTEQGWRAFARILDEEEVAELEEVDQLTLEIQERQRLARLRQIRAAHEQEIKDLEAAGFIHGAGGELIWGEWSGPYTFLHMQSEILLRMEEAAFAYHALEIPPQRLADVSPSPELAALAQTRILTGVDVEIPRLEAMAAEPEIQEKFLKTLGLEKVETTGPLFNFAKAMMYRTLEEMMWDLLVPSQKDLSDMAPDIPVQERKPQKRRDPGPQPSVFGAKAAA